MFKDLTCPVCRSGNVVAVGPLTIEGPAMELRQLDGQQCTLCGHLGVRIPQPWLVRLYPPDVRHITMMRRERARLRKQTRIGHR